MRFGLIKFKTNLDGEERYVWDVKRRRWVDDKGLEGRLLIRSFERVDVMPVIDIKKGGYYEYAYAVSERAVKELNLEDYVYEWIEANNVYELPHITNYTLDDLLKEIEDEGNK